MTEDETTLREIIRGFSKQPLDLDIFILKLLDVKAWHKADKENTIKAGNTDFKPLPTKEAKKALSDLHTHLGKAAKLFRRVNAGTMPMMLPLSVSVISSTNEISFSRVAAEIPLSVQHRNVATDLAPAILDWIKAETEKAAEELVYGQQTLKRVKEFDLSMLADWCEEAGITISYSDGTPFEKLSQWLLGQGSQRNTIEKIIERNEKFKGRKNKNSKS